MELDTILCFTRKNLTMNCVALFIFMQILTYYVNANMQWTFQNFSFVKEKYFRETFIKNLQDILC